MFTKGAGGMMLPSLLRVLSGNKSNMPGEGEPIGLLLSVRPLLSADGEPNCSSTDTYIA